MTPTIENKIIKITIPITEDFEKQIKARADQARQSLEDYIISTVKMRMKDDPVEEILKLKEFLGE